MFARFPFIRLVIALLLGITGYIVSNYFHTNFYLFLGAASSVLLLLVFTQLTFIRGLVIQCILVLTGWILTFQHNESLQKSHFQHTGQIKGYRAVVMALAEEKTKTYKTFAEVTQVFLVSGKEKQVSGKILLYVAKNTRYIPYPGDVLLIADTPRPTEPVQNPEEFDYKRYLSFQGVFHHQYLHGNDFVKSQPQVLPFYLHWAFRINTLSDQLFEQYLGKKREYGVMKAMILGVRNDLDNELIRSYSVAGAVHILSVSGLHVGVIFMFLGWILGWIRKTHRLGNWLFLAVVLSLLWFYAFVTGLSTPVLRSVLMFSIILVARTLSKRTSILNVIAFSAFILLCYNPYYLANVGFQLSYLALIGIVLFVELPLYKSIEARLKPNWINWRKVWKTKKTGSYFGLKLRNIVLIWVLQLTYVGFAATLATLPLTIYYFHQFPVYFWLTNPVVILLSSVALVLGLGFLAFFWSKTLLYLIGTCLFAVVWLLNESTLLVQGLPFSVITQLYLTLSEVILLFLLIGSLFFLWKNKSYFFVKTSLGLVFLLLISVAVDKIRQLSQHELIFHYVPKQVAFAHITGKKLYFFCPKSLANNRREIDFHLSNYWIRKGIRSEFFHPIDTTQQAGVLSVIAHKSILYLDELPKKKMVHFTGDSLDYVILGKKTAYRLPEIMGEIPAKSIIFDGSVSDFQLKKFSHTYSLKKNGSMVIPL